MGHQFVGARREERGGMNDKNEKDGRMATTRSLLPILDPYPSLPSHSSKLQANVGQKKKGRTITILTLIICSLYFIHIK
jgi:hypothetical protein